MAGAWWDMILVPHERAPMRVWRDRFIADFAHPLLGDPELGDEQNIGYWKADDFSGNLALRLVIEEASRTLLWRDAYNYVLSRFINFAMLVVAHQTWGTTINVARTVDELIQTRKEPADWAKRFEDVFVSDVFNKEMPPIVIRIKHPNRLPVVLAVKEIIANGRALTPIDWLSSTVVALPNVLRPA